MQAALALGIRHPDVLSDSYATRLNCRDSNSLVSGTY